jgi:hypothetical protein
MNNPKVNILVLNWNGDAVLNSCIKSILKSKYDNYYITVIDNGSLDDSINNLIKNEKINLIRINKNLGYSKGYNFAFEKIKNNDDDYFLILNNDTILNENTISTLVDSINVYGKNNIYGPKILNHNNGNNWFCGGGINLISGMPFHFGLNTTDLSINYKTREVSYISGCCMLINKEIFSQLMGFNQIYEMYFEDVDICVRARKNGYKCIYVSNSSIRHLVSYSLGGSFSYRKYLIKFKSFIKFLYSTNNIILFTFYLFINLLLSPLYIIYFLINKYS